MSKPQPSVSIPFGREWRIKRPFVYRYLERRFVDSFFETGTLRLSSFASFAKHADEQRLDSGEGDGVVCHRNSGGTGQTIIARLCQGRNAFVLCGATCFRTELADAFGTDSGFRIDDTLAFADVVSRYVPGFCMGIEGPCHYSPKKLLVRDMGAIDFDSLKADEDANKVDLQKLMALVSTMAGDDMFFLKSDRFAHQNEYRLLWHTPNDVAGHIDISCPEARQFCTRFEDLLAETMNDQAEGRRTNPNEQVLTDG